MGDEFYSRFKGEGVTKILTIEASGIGIACEAAKKTQTKNIASDVYTARVESFTHFR